MSGANDPTLRLSPPEWLQAFVDARLPAEDDRARMALAIALSAQGAERGEGGPFGAAIFDDLSGEFIAAGCNLVFTGGVSLAHAEMVVLSFVQRSLGCHDLSARPLTLYSSSEPCAMCTAALPWAGIRRVVCGARNEDVQRIGFDEGCKSAAWVEALQSRGIAVQRDVLREDAVRVLQAYSEQQGRMY